MIFLNPYFVFNFSPGVDRSMSNHRTCSSTDIISTNTHYSTASNLDLDFDYYATNEKDNSLFSHCRSRCRRR